MRSDHRWCDKWFIINKLHSAFSLILSPNQLSTGFWSLEVVSSYRVSLLIQKDLSYISRCEWHPSCILLRDLIKFYCYITDDLVSKHRAETSYKARKLLTYYYIQPGGVCTCAIVCGHSRVTHDFLDPYGKRITLNSCIWHFSRPSHNNTFVINQFRHFKHQSRS